MPKPLLMMLPAVLLASGLAAQGPRDLPMLVDAEWLAENLDVPELMVMQVDGRRDAYDTGHIPGAVFLPYDRIATEVAGVPVELPRIEVMVALVAGMGLRDDSYVVLYGEPLAAARAWMTLDYLGIGDRVAILDGGLDAWTAAGFEVAVDRPTRGRGTLRVSPVTQRVVDADWVLARLDHPAMLLIDARPGAGDTRGDGGGGYLTGHIPGARHLPWEDLTRSPEDPRYLPEAELRARFEAAGAAPDKVVVVYSQTGVRASAVYFVARLLGYQARLYDGSWHDWSARGLPVETGPDSRAPGP